MTHDEETVERVAKAINPEIFAPHMDDPFTKMCKDEARSAARRALSAMPAPTVQEAAKVRPEAIAALESYQQADMDGVMVLVSRQAVEECLPALRALAEGG